MSAGDDGPIGRREVAYRLFAAEYDGADLDYSDSDEERAPNYVVTPTGARVNRLFVVGVLTEVEPVSDDVLRARVVDPTGAFVAYAGQYQPEAVAFLEDADVPSFVSLTGKARTFQPDGSDRVFTSVRPESITAVDAETRDRWTVQAAEHTLARVATMARALEREERGEALQTALREAGVTPGFASGVALAIDHYGTTPAYLAAVREQAIAAAEVVTGAREAVPELDLTPDDPGPVEGDLTAAPVVVGTLPADAELSAPSAAPEEPAEPAEPAPDGDEADATESDVDETEAPERVVDETDATEPEVDETETPEPAEPAGDGAEATDAPEPSGAPAETPDAPDSDDDLGDFEAPTVAEEAEGSAEPYELDDEEREQVEAEFGTEFSTGSEVGEPGEAGIEPEVDPPATDDVGESPESEQPSRDAAPVDDDEGATTEAESEPPDADPEPESTDAEVDLEDAAVEAMGDLDDGDGADRDAVVEAVVDAHGADAEAVEAAIQEALMGGRCYEPADGTLKAI